MSAAVLIAALLAAAAGVVAAGLAPADPDLFWHLQSGDWMLDHGRILDRDVFSFTRSGANYASGQWLGQIGLALAYRAGGWLGIDLLRAALVACGAYFTARATLRMGAHPLWSAAVIVAALLVSKITWADRPQLFTVALFPLVLDLLLAARLEGRVRRLVLVPVLVLLWANLHGAFAVGLVLVALFGAEALIARAPGARAFALTLALSLVAAQLNPAAGGALGWAAAYAASPASYIVEERPPDVLTPPGALFGVLLALAFGAALLSGRDRIAARLGAPLLWPALLVPFALLGLSVQRQMPLACAVLAPFVAAAVPLALGRTPFGTPRITRAAAILGVVLILVGAAGGAVVVAPREPDLRAYPVLALNPLRIAEGRLLNEYDWGGYLIRYAPEHPTFIDGRGGLLYVPGVLDDFQRAALVRPGYREVLRAWDIRLVLLRPERPLVDALRADGWSVVASAPVSICEVGAPFVLLARP